MLFVDMCRWDQKSRLYLVLRSRDQVLLLDVENEDLRRFVEGVMPYLWVRMAIVILVVVFEFI